ncbi:MAG: M24 family metallopeptidase [Candidatus Paceibacterota bacterium]|jgi:Xaa-Pro aminopeptidase
MKNQGKKIKLIHEIRAVKSRKELAYIVKAQRISEKVLTDTVKKLRTGVTELEIADLIKKAYISHGVNVLSFPPIVAFGKNTANIHHEPNKTKLKKGNTVMFDFGCTVNHYCSDMTRTYFWGEPSAKQKKIYLIVLEAQEIAISKIEKGERQAKVIDNVARKFLNKKYRNKSASDRPSRDGFPHGLGHGVGTVIHEWPNFKPKSEDILPTGCVMTIEPGLYFKGFGGIRIEDMILITKNGCKNLTNFPKDLKNAII